eukprot:200232-Pyramimonas_sp.AAC.1
MNQVGDNLSLGKVEGDLKKTFGLDSMPSYRASSGAAAYHVDDYEEFDEQDDVYYGGDDEKHYYDDYGENHQETGPSFDLSLIHI